MIDKFIYIKPIDMVDLFLGNDIKFPRYVRMDALKTVMESDVIELRRSRFAIADEKKNRLAWFLTFTEYQLENLLFYFKDVELNKKYLKELWLNITSYLLKNKNIDQVIFAKILNLSRGAEMQMPENILKYNSYLKNLFYDKKSQLDGLEIKLLRPVLAKSATTEEIKEIARKYEINVPTRLKKNEYLSLIVDTLKQNGKYKESKHEVLNDMTIVELRKFSISNRLKLSPDLNKESMIEFILANSIQTKNSYYKNEDDYKLSLEDLGIEEFSNISFDHDGTATTFDKLKKQIFDADPENEKYQRVFVKGQSLDSNVKDPTVKENELVKRYESFKIDLINILENLSKISNQLEEYKEVDFTEIDPEVVNNFEQNLKIQIGRVNQMETDVAEIEARYIGYETETSNDHYNGLNNGIKKIKDFISQLSKNITVLNAEILKATEDARLEELRKIHLLTEEKLEQERKEKEELLKKQEEALKYENEKLKEQLEAANRKAAEEQREVEEKNLANVEELRAMRKAEREEEKQRINEELRKQREEHERMLKEKELEHERMLEEKLEKARLEAEEKARLEAEELIKAEKEKLEQERKEQEELELKSRLEAERLEKEKEEIERQRQELEEKLVAEAMQKDENVTILDKQENSEEVNDLEKQRIEELEKQEQEEALLREKEALEKAKQIEEEKNALASQLQQERLSQNLEQEKFQREQQDLLAQETRAKFEAEKEALIAKFEAEKAKMEAERLIEKAKMEAEKQQEAMLLKEQLRKENEELLLKERREKEEAEMLAKRLEEEKIAQEQILKNQLSEEQQAILEAERIEKERILAEKLELQSKLEAEQLEKERLENEKQEIEKQKIIELEKARLEAEEKAKELYENKEPKIVLTNTTNQSELESKSEVSESFENQEENQEKPYIEIKPEYDNVKFDDYVDYRPRIEVTNYTKERKLAEQKREAELKKQKEEIKKPISESFKDDKKIPVQEFNSAERIDPIKSNLQNQNPGKVYQSHNINSEPRPQQQVQSTARMQQQTVQRPQVQPQQAQSYFQQRPTQNINRQANPVAKKVNSAPAKKQKKLKPEKIKLSKFSRLMIALVVLGAIALVGGLIGWLVYNEVKKNKKTQTPQTQTPAPGTTGNSNSIKTNQININF